MANNPVTLSTAWKQSLTTTKMKPFAMQVSLFDLMFYEDEAKITRIRFLDNTEIKPEVGQYRSKGFELPHSIIVFNEGIYRNPEENQRDLGHRIIIQAHDEDEKLSHPESTLFSEFVAQGFDMAMPYFDVRSKPLFLTSTNSRKILGLNDIEDHLNKFKPEKLENSDYYWSSNQNQSDRALGFKVWDKDAAMKPTTSSDFYIRSILATPTNEDNWSSYGNPWTVASEEDYLLYGTEGILADIILSNKDVSFEKRFLTDSSVYSAYNGVCVNFFSRNVWRQLYKYYGAPDNVIPTDSDIAGYLSLDGQIANLDPCIKFLLQHCYIWFKCSFYADYVDYRDFDQSLNKEATVLHKNLMLTNTGNFNRYKELYEEKTISNSDYRKRTRPYLPATTPSKDLVRKQLINENIFANNPNAQIELNGQVKSALQWLIDDSNEPESSIGAIPVEPFELIIEGQTSPNFTSGPQDTIPPPIWFDPESRKQATDYSAFPTTIGKDGNLITAGRVISPTIDELWQTIKELIGGRRADITQVTADDNGGYPKGVGGLLQTTTSSQPSIINHTFIDSDNIKRTGDPISIEYLESTDTEPASWRVKSWINNPDTIVYKVIDELKSISTNICSVAPNWEVLIDKINDLPEPSKYLPNAQPMSLRELEGAMKGIRWNLAYYMKFLETYGVYAGSIGRQNTDVEDYNNSAGTAYQLHSGYIGKEWNNPETVYDERINRGIDVPGMGLGKITDEMFADNDQNKVPPWTVYMGADGQWHSTWQNTNIPIREDEQW